MKKLKMMIVAVAAALMLAGCTVSAPGFEVVGSVPSGTITALETIPTETKYEFGDLVYTLETWPDGTVHVCRHAVVELLTDCDCLYPCKSADYLIENGVEVAPVVHGRWVLVKPRRTGRNATYKCTACGQLRSSYYNDVAQWKHCPCGAKMDRKVDR